MGNSMFSVFFPLLSTWCCQVGGSIPPLLTAHLASAEAAEVERQSAERLRLHTEYLALSADPLLRLPMGGLGPIPGGTLPPPPGLPSSGSTGPAPTAGSSSHTHTHAHSHTHLHLHQPDIGVLPFHPLALPPVLPPGLPGKPNVLNHNLFTAIFLFLFSCLCPL